MNFRQATLADAPHIAELVVAGFTTYKAFAAPGWSPPTFERELAEVAEILAEPSAWCRLAEDELGLAGHVGWHAAAVGPRRIDEPGLAHLWQLFLRRDRWGSGLAATLQAASLEAAARDGYETIRLLTPAAHARGRRFYEREGWTLQGKPFEDESFGMPLVEYRRALHGELARPGVSSSACRTANTASS